MKRRSLQWFGLVAAVFILIAVGLLIQHLMQQQANRPVPVQEMQSQYPEVAVIAVRASEYTAQIGGYGESSAHFSLTLTAQTSGQVMEQAEIFEPGCRVIKGTRLVQLDDSEYRSAVANAESELASARLDFLEEQRQVVQAKTEWQASGLSGEPDSSLVLREPQLAAAKAAVVKAEAALESAETTLSRTQITTPFDALVVDRLTTPGSYLQKGTDVATLYSTDRMEISVPLSSRDWANLPEPETLNRERWPVKLTDVENGQIWSGRVLRAEQHRDGQTRQRTLLVAVDFPLDQSPQLLPGTFVQAELAGRTVKDVWQLPITALSQRGEVWYITDENSLARFTVEPLFSDEKHLYVAVPDKFATAAVRVVVHPLSSYLPGMRVIPVQENDHA